MNDDPRGNAMHTHSINDGPLDSAQLQQAENDMLKMVNKTA